MRRHREEGQPEVGGGLVLAVAAAVALAGGACSTERAVRALDDGGSGRDAGSDGGHGGGAVEDTGPAADGGETVDADGAFDAGEEGGDAGTDRPLLGSSGRPIAITSFPFRDERSTASGADSAIDAYGCAPEVDESGPEVHYELVVDEPVILGGTVAVVEGVDVDLHLLAGSSPEACVARGDAAIEASLRPGTYRFVVDTPGGEPPPAGEYVIEAWVTAPEPERLGDFDMEYYFVALEREHEGPRSTPLYDSSCSLIAEVRQDFAAALCIEGSGVLEDGRVVNYAGTCTDSCRAAPTCGSGSRRVCYVALDPSVYPWGMGAAGVPLAPDVSIALSTDVAPVGTVLYVEELDGLVPPPEASGPHDGCVRVDDTGSIGDDALRLFAGTRERWRGWEGLVPTGTSLTVWRDHPRCFGL